MSKVQPITGGVIIPTSGPDAECVEALEMLLERARTGEIVGFAVAAITADGSVLTAWKGGATTMQLGAAVSWLQHRYMSAWDRN